MTVAYEETVDIAFTLNGEAVTTQVSANLPLVTLLRDGYRLKGTKIACSRAVCGACTVLVDGEPAAACALFAFQVDGRKVVTIEGLGDAAQRDPVQRAFAETGALQCGYCTAGMILLARALIDRDPTPDRETITDWISSGICRCTGYQMIVEAVELAARYAGQEAGGDAR